MIMTTGPISKWSLALITITSALLLVLAGSSSQEPQGGATSAKGNGLSGSVNTPVFNADVSLGGSPPNGGNNGGEPSGPSGGGLNVNAPTSKPDGLLNKVKGKLQNGKEAIKSSINDITGNDNKQQQQPSSSGSIFSPPTTPKPEGLFDKISEAAHRSKEAFEGSTPAPTGIGEKLKNAISRGGEAIKDGVKKAEDKVGDFGERVSNSVNETISGPSGSSASSGSSGSTSSNNNNVNDNSRSSLFGGSSKSQQEQQANKSPTVEIFDKAIEVAKAPVESLLKPIDKALGYEKDPLLKVVDDSHDALRKPLGMIAKPVDSLLNGVFKTSDEAKKESERLVSQKSFKEQQQIKKGLEEEKKANRSIVGSIADKTVELATKPIEIILKPLDRALGYEKDGKKNPVISTINEIYNLSKKPIDKIAKPFEKILKKMAQEDGGYQLSIRYGGNSTAASAAASAGNAVANAASSALGPKGSSSHNKADPKLITRLADGALNIADRIVTKPLEIIMRPLTKALGYEDDGKKNPIVEATHQLKNATKIGVELFTKPIDRMIHEISEIGEPKSESERELEKDKQHDEASRLVEALDRIHEIIQIPFEVVLTPVSKAMGITKEGKQEPLLHAWDIIHQVLRTPIQIISKPVEDAILGEKPKQGHKERKHHNKKHSHSNQVEPSENVITDGIKSIEKIASKPIEKITSPVRKLILGEEAGSRSSKGGQEGEPEKKDKIMQTIEKVNNVILKPLEVITQPLSDIIKPNSNNNSGSNGKQQQSSPQQQRPSSGGQSQAQGQSRNNNNNNKGAQSQSQTQAQAGGGSASQSQAQSQSQSTQGQGQGQSQAQSQSQSQRGQAQSQSQSQSSVSANAAGGQANNKPLGQQAQPQLQQPLPMKPIGGSGPVQQTQIQTQTQIQQQTTVKRP